MEERISKKLFTKLPKDEENLRAPYQVSVKLVSGHKFQQSELFSQIQDQLVLILTQGRYKFLLSQGVPLVDAKELFLDVWGPDSDLRKKDSWCEVDTIKFPESSSYD